MSFCPTKDIHSVYLDGELPEVYKAEYEQHIQNCEKCRKELMQLKAIHSLFKADSDSMNLDSHYMDESFQRLQIKMAYSKNIGKTPKKSPFKVISYVTSGIAAAAVFALVLPSGAKEEKTENITVAAPIATSIPMKAVSTAKTVSANNVSFDSGRSVVLSGNIQDVVLSSENQRKSISFFANKDVNDVDVLRPDFQDEAISIKITVPGMGDSAVTTEINLPMDVVSGRR
ncbi:MAG: zf-HC2 domain-containing protein [Treponema sp.]|nr:zf-HC2 domain-containing protein [Treponema sp.]